MLLLEIHVFFEHLGREKSDKSTFTEGNKVRKWPNLCPILRWINQTNGSICILCVQKLKEGHMMKHKKKLIVIRKRKAARNTEENDSLFLSH